MLRYFCQISMVLLLVLCLGLWQPTQAKADIFNGKPAIKMLTFNTGGTDDKAPLAQQQARWRQLAEYAKSTNLEVILLQELTYSPNPSGVRDYGVIIQAFQEAGYPMYEVHLEIPGADANMILSKYPFVPNSYSYWELDAATKRYPQSVTIQTPYGPLRVVNIHTHFVYGCDQVARIFEAYTTPGNAQFSVAGEPIIIAGDYNVYFDQFAPVSSRNCQGSAQEEQRLQAVLPATKLACIDPSRCTNIANRFIDLFFSLQSSRAQIYQTWEDDAVKNLGNGHPPIVALVGDSAWQETRQSPTSTALKTLSYNVHHGTQLTAEQHQQKMASLAEYIKQNQIELVALQEMNYGEFAGDVSGDDAEYLQSALASVQYPMYMAVADKQKGYFRNVILSKYAIDESSITTLPLKTGGEGRTILTANVPITPIGPISVIATHLRESCDASLELKSTMTRLNNDSSILMGDFNHTSTGTVGQWGFGAEGTCPIGLDTIYQYTCDGQPCDLGTTIDYTLVKKGGNLHINSRWKDQIALSDHLPVISVIRTSAVVSPPPSENPSLSPPTDLTVSCDINRVNASEIQAVFRWTAAANAQRYKIRINSSKTCVNTNGVTVDWYCPDQNSPALGDRVFVVNANTACSGSACALTVPVESGLVYRDWSVQTAAGNPSQEQTSNLASVSIPLTCTTADVTGDGQVSEADYAQLVGDLYTNQCRSNLVGMCPDLPNAAITIQDFNQLLMSLRR